jgi:hypothetical protein
VRGLLRLMGDARRALAGGISQDDASVLRDRITAALTATQEECRRRMRTPLDLPAPSRRAYAFLSSLDLSQLPIRSGLSPLDSGLRIRNLVGLRNRIQRELTSLARRSLKVQGQLEWSDFTLSDVHTTCADLAERIEVRLAETGMSADRLPDPSRRAYRWFRWVADVSHLQAHHRAAVTCMRVDPRVVAQLYNQAALYKATLHGESIHLTIHEAFASAPDEVLVSLVKVVLPYTRKRRWRETIRRYVEGESFREDLMAIESGMDGPSGATQGRAYDLSEVYERVNRDLLGGIVTRPRLMWTDRPTGREFGSYQPLTDTVTISVSLDSPEVPAFVVEHVMHHELLHKLLGTPTENGRRRVHTPTFRRRERAFPRYEQADAFLHRLSRGLQS